MRIEDLTDEQIAQMSDEELQALGAAEFGGAPAEEPVEDDPEGLPDPAVLPPGAEPAPVDPAAEPAPDYAAQYAALEAQHQHLLAQLNDPSRVRAHLAALDPTFGQPATDTPAPPAEVAPPSWDEDPDAALAYVIQQATAPLVAQIQTLQERDNQRAAQDQERQLMMTMAGKHGQDFESTLREFDTQHPHLRDLHPELRYMAALGLRSKSAPAVDPAADEARIKAAAQQLLAEQLKGGRPLAGVPTLGGAPQGVADEGPVDLARLDYGSMMAMPLDKMLEAGRKTFGGG